MRLKESFNRKRKIIELLADKVPVGEIARQIGCKKNYVYMVKSLRDRGLLTGDLASLNNPQPRVTSKSTQETPVIRDNADDNYDDLRKQLAIKDRMIADFATQLFMLKHNNSCQGLNN